MADAYIGYRSAGRRPEQHNDRTASANAPLSAVRGYLAGTLGLPGDIEGLGRMLIPGVNNKSYIPGSEYFRKVLPMSELEDTPTGRAFSEIGNLTGGTGVLTAAKLAGKAGKAGTRIVGEELNRAILDSSGPLAKLVPQAAKPLYVVPPQGNVNLKPMARAEILKGPDAQTPENFLNQLRGKPGMTQEGFDDLVKQYQGLEPNTRMTKGEFEQRIPASQYNKVDLANSAESADAHLLTQAEDMVNDNRYHVYEGMLDRLGVAYNNNNMSLLDNYHNQYLGFEDLTPELQQALKRSGMDTPDGRAAINDLFSEERSNSVNNTFQSLREQEYAYSGLEPGGYAYRDYQRLLENPKASESGYFELGVSHPDQMSGYKHYPGHEGEEGLIGHVRGTFISADAPDEARQLIQPRLLSDEKIFAKPNSMIIEEIQSDAQKGKAQSGALRQAHGTMFKAAIQHALENGADTVYYPTAKTIGGVRLKESSKYAPIYDQQIVKEGLKPLLKIPGVDSNKIGDSYYEINFTPEAKDVILKGEGQAAPGYAEGGHVAYDSDQVDRIVQGFDKGGPVRAGDGLPDPSLINLPLYARTVSEEMFPDERDNPKRDAARHMLASAIAAQKTSPGIAEFLGKAYEFKEAPLRTTGYFLGLSEPRSDYHTDLHNNAIGVQLGKDNRTLRAMLDAVERETNRGTSKTQPGRASLRPDAVSKYAEGGSVTAYDPSRVDAILNEFM